MIKGFIASNSLKQTFSLNLSPYNISENDFLNISIEQSSISSKVASAIDIKIKQNLQTAAFLMEIGKIISSKQLLEDNKANDFKIRLKELHYPDEIQNLEKEMIEMSSDEITLEIFKQWNFDDEITEILKNLNKNKISMNNLPEKSALGLLIIKNACNVLGNKNEEQINKVNEISNNFNLNILL